MSLHVQIKGLDIVNKRLGKAQSTVNDKLVAAVNMATGVVEGGAKGLCPVRTGALRESIHSLPARVEGGDVVGTVYTNMEYAPYVEFGTGARGDYPYKTELNLEYKPGWPGQKAQPFLGKSLHLNEKNIKAIVKEAMNKAVENV